ncbi:MAG: hypoxanthine phosphoribosyltransferase [Clostridiales bacterium]|jgi:hypoxanthine phosphoribosyltransferase|nr:hypoxanthine phosphoribosyltransferase [Clostridiales bacterium]HOB63542.1 hypoxanthine phosphoribosyltransferase [Clostridia bacterium]HOK82498.1 hypoxanthine phosphoribosyltransferase [Clostridia bacterium]HOL61610.1 hypoxanthine phosphoribosyltransferase [Clostridia bacterium]HPO54250.1 hypoxanthine phosphoribosyltransferase [Clostridia bacterium]
MHKDVLKVLLTKEQIAQRTKELAEQINKDYAGKSVLMICILRGAVLFFADLARLLDVDVRLDFMAVSSYGAGTSTSGEVRIVKDVSQPIEGLHVILVEDIIDTGHTLKYLKRLMESRNPASLKICALLDKPSRRETDLQGDYVGFEVPNEFVVGFGLDYAERYRNLPDVCVLKPEIYGGK